MAISANALILAVPEEFIRLPSASDSTMTPLLLRAT